MLDVIFQSGLLILCGVAWRLTTPLGLDATDVRRHLTGVVYVLLLPALVLVVIWKAPLSEESLYVALSAAIGVLSGAFLAWLWFQLRPQSPPMVGAMILAAAFPNATYLGLPVLEASFGPWARSIAIQYDLFACTPLLLSAGAMLAARYGGSGAPFHPWREIIRIPPLWAAIFGAVLNLTGVPLPTLFEGLLEKLGAGVVPLMLFSLGLGLQWAGGWGRDIARVSPVVIIQIVVVPFIVWGVVNGLGMSGDKAAAVVLEAAMPSMVLGVVLCDRYRLDTHLYAMAVTLSTVVAMFSLPLWFSVLTGT